MTLFFLLYIAVYGSANAYACWKLCHGSVLTAATWARIALPFIIAGLVLAPVFSHMLHRASFHRLSSAVALIGYWWMAIVFWTVCVGVLFDAWNILAALASRAGLTTAWHLPGSTQRLLFLFTLILLCLWGVVEGRFLRVNTFHIATEKMPAGAEPIRIVQLTDCHFGLTQRRRVMKEVLSEITAAKPDLLLCTGDVFDVQVHNPAQYIAAFREIEAPLGKFLVTGNHEYYTGIGETLKILEDSGFVTLRESSALLDGWLRIAGVDDPAGARVEEEFFTDETKALAEAQEGEFVILLKHRPVINPETANMIDLQLSGHTHGGQIFPFHAFVRIAYPLGHGMRENGGGGLAYVSRGVGNWGPPMRVLAPRELTVFVLEPLADPAQ